MDADYHNQHQYPDELLAALVTNLAESRNVSSILWTVARKWLGYAREVYGCRGFVAIIPPMPGNLPPHRVYRLRCGAGCVAWCSTFLGTLRLHGIKHYRGKSLPVLKDAAKFL
jgi:hypothetical protein